MNQPGPFQHGFWAKLTNNFSEPLLPNAENLHAFRTLLLLMTQRRRADQERVFVKFISWNVLYIDFIMKAFPEVPAIFLYRDPVEIIASVRHSATAILEAKDLKKAEFLSGRSRSNIDRIGATEYLALCYRRSFETIADWQSSGLSLLDYSELTRRRFPGILARSFNLRPDLSAIREMQAQFATYSKDDSDTRTFDQDGDSKRNAISEADQRLIADISGEALRRTRQDRRNLFTPSALRTEGLEKAPEKVPATIGS